MAEGWNAAERRNGGMAERPATYNGGIVDWWLGYVLNLHDLFKVHTDTDDSFGLSIVPQGHSFFSLMPHLSLFVLYHHSHLSRLP